MKLLVDVGVAQHSVDPLADCRSTPRWHALIERMAEDAEPDHELHVLLNSGLPLSAVQLRKRFESAVGADRVHHYAGNGQTARSDGSWLDRAMDVVRGAAIARVGPDALLTVRSGLSPTASFFGVNFDVGLDGAARRVNAEPPQAAHFDGFDEELAWSSRFDYRSARDVRAPFVRYLTDSVWAWGEVPVADVDADRESKLVSPASPFVLLLVGRWVGDVSEIVETLTDLASSHRLPPLVVSSLDAQPGVEVGSTRAAAGQSFVVARPSTNELRQMYRAASAVIACAGCDAVEGSVLDAMIAGCPAVAAKGTSIASILEPDQQFDSADPAQVARCVQRVVQHGRRAEAGSHVRQALARQVALAARSAWRLLDGGPAARTVVRAPQATSRVPRQRPRLAIVSPFPPTQSGVARYTEDLTGALGAHYDVERIDPTVRGEYRRRRVRGVRWFGRHAAEFDRVLYHFGNSRFHWPMFELIDRVPGVAVLHDVFLSGVISDAHFRGAMPGAWPRMLFEAHGYPALQTLIAGTSEEAVWRYPTNRHVLANADGIVVHSDHARRLASDLLGERVTQDWITIPLARSLIDTSPSARQRARARVGIAEDEFVVASFGMLGPTKLNGRVLDAFVSSTLGRDDKCRLIFVGGHADSASDRDFLARLECMGNPERFRTTGHVGQELFEAYLLAADVAVQLRTRSRGESSAAVLDCLNAGVPVVANEHGSVPDLPTDTVLRIPDTFRDDELASALDRLRSDPGLAMSMSRTGRALIESRHDPRAVAVQFHTAIERFTARGWSRTGIGARLRELGRPVRDSDARTVAQALAITISPPAGRKQLLVDASGLAEWTPRTGVERVQSEILSAVLRDPPDGWFAEPVYATATGTFRYARKFVQQVLSPELELGPDVPIDVSAGDVMLVFSRGSAIEPRNADALRRLRAAGVRVHFILVPPMGAGDDDTDAPRVRGTLALAAELGGLSCVTQGMYERAVRLTEAHEVLGAALIPDRLDLGASLSVLCAPGLTDHLEAIRLIDRMQTHPSCLMVGPSEERKSHREVIKGFEMAWSAGIDVSLVVVGDHSRGDRPLGPEIRRHPEYDRRLLATGHVSDSTLAALYCFARASVSASSYGGLGTTCAESLYRGVAVLARDTPTYRAIAGTAATYFRRSDEIADALRAVLQVKRSEPYGSLRTWSEATARLLAKIGVG